MGIAEIKRLRKPTDRARQRSRVFEELLSEMKTLEVGEQMAYKGRSRFDTPQIKRLAHQRFPTKWFEIYGRTELDGNYWVYITLTNIEEE